MPSVGRRAAGTNRQRRPLPARSSCRVGSRHPGVCSLRKAPGEHQGESLRIPVPRGLGLHLARWDTPPRNRPAAPGINLVGNSDAYLCAFVSRRSGPRNHIFLCGVQGGVVRLRGRPCSLRRHGPRLRQRTRSLREHSAGLRGQPVSRGRSRSRSRSRGHRFWSRLGLARRSQRHRSRVQRLLSRHDDVVRVAGDALSADIRGTDPGVRPDVRRVIRRVRRVVRPPLRTAAAPCTLAVTRARRPVTVRVTPSRRTGTDRSGNRPQRTGDGPGWGPEWGPCGEPSPPGPQRPRGTTLGERERRQLVSVNRAHRTGSRSPTTGVVPVTARAASPPYYRTP
ncbi:hypothetical protein SAMN05444521_0017 [Streptomyces sp. 3214.6]|nr:hypothetical protein SAMN05444521_0017 [Streptomyces sp. 3214.6]